MSESSLPDRLAFLQRFLQDNPTAVRKSFAAVKSTELPANPHIASKFGGVAPYLAEGKQWPKCSECSKKKSFVCQINISTIPKDAQNHIGLSSGLFQLFMCFECSPFENVFVDVEIIPQEQLELPSLQLLAGVASSKVDVDAETVPGTVKKFIRELKQEGDSNLQEDRPQTFVEWEENEKKEIMNNEEISDEFNDFADQLNDSEWEAFDELEDETDALISTPNSGIKLCGYVRWCQGVEYPTCPDCNVLMKTTFLQIEEDEIYCESWGDAGTAHVTLCPSCKKPGLGWACA